MKLSPRDAAARHFANHPFCPPGSVVIVAVSGGPDSTALLDALIHAVDDQRYRFVVAHLHHGIRGTAADIDQAFVGDTARTHGLEFHTARVSVTEIAEAEKRSLEDAARRARRSFLDDVRAKTGARAVALGHTKNDQAETLLMNLLRGAGPKGLAAMPDYGPGCFTRPLLQVSRGEVLAYLAAADIPFRNDATNLDPERTRNRIRHEFLPLLETRFNTNIVDTLARQADLFSEIDAWLGAEAAQRLAETRSRPSEAGTRSFAIADLRALPRAVLREVLRGAVRDLTGHLEGVGRDHIDALLRLIQRSESGHADLPGLVVDRDGSALVFRTAGATAAPARPSDSDPPPRPLEPGVEIPWRDGHIRPSLITADCSSDALRPPDGRQSAWFDADRLGGTLWLRALGPGDRLRPHGMSGHRKVSDIFTDRKIAGRRRNFFSALVHVTGEDDRMGPEEILWIPGLVRSDHAAVTPATRRILLIDVFGQF